MVAIISMIDDEDHLIYCHIPIKVVIAWSNSVKHYDPPQLVILALVKNSGLWTSVLGGVQLYNACIDIGMQAITTTSVNTSQASTLVGNIILPVPTIIKLSIHGNWESNKEGINIANKKNCLLQGTRHKMDEFHGMMSSQATTNVRVRYSSRKCVVYPLLMIAHLMFLG